MHKRVLLFYGDRIKVIVSRAIMCCREGFSAYFRIENKLKIILAILRCLKLSIYILFGIVYFGHVPGNCVNR